MLKEKKEEVKEMKKKLAAEEGREMELEMEEEKEKEEKEEKEEEEKDVSSQLQEVRERVAVSLFKSIMRNRWRREEQNERRERSWQRNARDDCWDWTKPPLTRLASKSSPLKIWILSM